VSASMCCLKYIVNQLLNFKSFEIPIYFSYPMSFIIDCVTDMNLSSIRIDAT